jgi:K(+)-stimulated pyrophosphate-energized sodium pump
MKSPEGTPDMRAISSYVREGAMAYLKQQYKVVAIVVVIAALVFGFMSFVLKVQSKIVPIAFMTGAFFSGLSGFIGMRMATHANSRTAFAARESLNGALRVAFRAGAVMGLTVVGLGLLPMSLWFLGLVATAKFTGMTLGNITMGMLGYGIGASTQALFARVGGGIFTKGADVGADLVGKLEAGIPEDDPRNPAVIADNVGDNVGDVAGMGADLYESYCGAVLAAGALAAAAGLGMAGAALPAAVAGIGIILSMIGVFVVRTGEDTSQEKLLKALARGVNLSSALIVLGSGALCYFMLRGNPGNAGLAQTLRDAHVQWWGIWGAIVAGLISGIVIGYASAYYTSDAHKPTRGIAASSQTGPATVIIQGIAVGMRSTWLAVVSVAAAILLAFTLSGGFQNTALGLFGIGIAAVGMLSTLGVTLATDAYGPIADNAGGNAQMTHQEPYVRERTDALDALGNTTAAQGKGFAIGSAALTALALISSYMEEVKQSVERTFAETGHAILGPDTITTADQLKQAVAGDYMTSFMQKYNVTLLNPKVVAGLFIGSMVVFLFCSFTMRAVGRAAEKVVEEVRRQFREIKGLMEGTGKADYARCVEISTRGAQREMIFPSLMAILVPILTGLVLGVSGVMGVLMGATAAGFVLAIMLANTGGAWDNAKKYIERGNLGGKGSPQHKAAVVGDTVGDPFKDTSGPALNIMIKLMSMVAVMFGGLTVKFGPKIAAWLHIGKY